MTKVFVPLERMLARVSLAHDDSDTAYSFELLYMGEMFIKIVAVELLAGIQDDRDRQRYALEYRAVRADGIGAWADIIEEATAGPASHHLANESRSSQAALTASQSPTADTWQRKATDLLNTACRAIDTEYIDRSATKTSLRSWVRDFVWLRNRTRGHGATKASALAAACPALSSSLDLIAHNAPAFARNWAYLRRSLSGKYRVSDFGGDRDPYVPLTRDPKLNLPDGVYVHLDVPRPVSLVFSDADLSDFYLPNGAFRNGTFEALSYITDDTQRLEGVGWTLAADAEPLSETHAQPELDIVGNVFTNMPPRRRAYVPRPGLETELRTLILDDRHPVITLHGRGGVGKTSLALQTLHGVAGGNDFFAILWFSARDIDLLAEGPKVVRADVLSIDDIAEAFVALTMPGPVTSRSSARERLTDALSGGGPEGPYVCVFDNFETIRSQGELYAYLSNAVRLPNKVLITTRARDFKADYPVEVGGMTRPEYHQLVVEAAAQLGIDRLIDDAYEDRLYDESDGHPYITKVLLGEVAHAGRRVSFRPVAATKGAVLDALFDRSFASLSPGAQRVFLTLCGWRSLVPKIGLEAILLRPGSEKFDVDGALDELLRASLIEENWSNDRMVSFVSVPLAAALFGKSKLVTSPLKIAVEADLELLMSFGAATAGDVAAGLGPRVERLARALASRIAGGADPEQELAVLRYFATGYPPAWLQVSLVEEESGHLSAAIVSQSHYLEAFPEDVQGWRRLAQLYRSSNDTLGEMHARLELAERTRAPYFELSGSAARLNYLLSTRGISLESDERRLAVRRLRAVLEARIDEADATDLSRIAWLCVHDKDLVAADRWATRGLELDPANEHCRGLKRRLTESTR